MTTRMRTRRQVKEPSITTDLGGSWKFGFRPSAPEVPYSTVSDLEQAGIQLRSCRVPGNLELDLLKHGLIDEPFHGMNMVQAHGWESVHVWYAVRFPADVPEKQDPFLVFDGVDCFAEIYLNGRHLGSCDNMLVEHKFAVNSLLLPENELVVHIRPAREEAQKHSYPPSLAGNLETLYVRKPPHMYGWDIMPRAVSAGLWKTVRLEFRPRERIADLFLQNIQVTPDRASLDLRYWLSAGNVTPGKFEIRMKGRCGDSHFEATEQVRFSAGSHLFTVPHPQLWWPRDAGPQNLYDITVELRGKGSVLDRRQFRHGIRTVVLDRTDTATPDGKGEFCFRVNGERIFVRGTNWVPLDAFHSRDAERLPRALELLEDIGCNMVRCWGGNVYESKAFFDFCDRRGILVWQDFAMACMLYPQDQAFQNQIRKEARLVVRRLRQHASLALWAGDNECDLAWHGWYGRPRDPNRNVLTRRVLADVVEEEDGSRPYLPSSPYLSPRMLEEGAGQPEDHLWGPRDYYKSDFYVNSVCHFASEIGYHGCPSESSMRRFLSPGKVWPWQNNKEWQLHSTDPVPGIAQHAYRVELMARQVRELFGSVPETLDRFILASQISQAEAKKFFVELFRGHKWRRTGILWWNLLDGWPQFSDAVVDYYYQKKLAYHYLRRAQAPVCVMLREPANWQNTVVGVNDTRSDQKIRYSISDVDTKAILLEGQALLPANGLRELGEIPFTHGAQKFYVITWTGSAGPGRSHYLAGHPPFSLDDYLRWLRSAKLMPPRRDWAPTGK